MSTDHTDGAQLAKQAQVAWKHGAAGWYVENRGTHIIVRGPFETQLEAARVVRADPDCIFGIWGELP